jgi:anthranilate phosphoribosyltransferase
MKISGSAHTLRQMIEKAIEDHQLTKSEYEMIIHQATKGENIDNQEKALLSQLHELIGDKSVKLVP